MCVSSEENYILKTNKKYFPKNTTEYMCHIQFVFIHISMYDRPTCINPIDTVYFAKEVVHLVQWPFTITDKSYCKVIVKEIWIRRRLVTTRI